MKNLFMILVRVPLLVFFVITVVLVNLLQLVSLLLRPFSRSLFYRLSAGYAAVWWYFTALFVERLCGIELEISGEVPQDRTRCALVIANHQGFIDPFLIMILARRIGALRGLKWFAKYSLIYVPFLGWGLWFLESIFLRRNWDQDSEKIRDSFKRIKLSQDPIWLISFPEGTRKTSAKLLKSRKFAVGAGFNPFDHVLLPRYKGFAASIQGLGNRVELVYDLTLIYSHPKPNIFHLLTGSLGKVKIVSQIFSVESLPKDSIQVRDWLIARFREKDERIAQQIKKGV